MDRIKFASGIINNLADSRSILDVGSRGAELRSWLPKEIEYYANDLFQNDFNSIDFVGDILTLPFDQEFDTVVALEVLEHTDRPDLVFKKLYFLTRRNLIISLPNSYDLKSRFRFLIRGDLGGKYEFKYEIPLDRHRWVMSVDQIVGFFKSMEKKYFFSKLYIFPMRYGDPKGSFKSRCRSAARVFPESLSTESVFAVFQKN